jgi:hypothetical protein
MKTGLKTKVYARGFHFAGRDAIECVVEFRIDSLSIKKGTLINATRFELTLHMHST